LAIESSSAREAEEEGAIVELTVDKNSVAGYLLDSNDMST
jgi:hypothetical protein